MRFVDEILSTLAEVKLKQPATDSPVALTG